MLRLKKLWTRIRGKKYMPQVKVEVTITPYEKVIAHRGHRIEVITYGYGSTDRGIKNLRRLFGKEAEFYTAERVAVVCTTCDIVFQQYDNPNTDKIKRRHRWTR